MRHRTADRELYICKCSNAALLTQMLCRLVWSVTAKLSSRWLDTYLSFAMHNICIIHHWQGHESSFMIKNSIVISPGVDIAIVNRVMHVRQVARSPLGYRRYIAATWYIMVVSKNTAILPVFSYELTALTTRVSTRYRRLSTLSLTGTRSAQRICTKKHRDRNLCYDNTTRLLQKINKCKWIRLASHADIVQRIVEMYKNILICVR